MPTAAPLSFGGKGKSSTSAVFDHNLRGEITYWLGGFSATVLLDLWKCYELVLPLPLMQEAEATGFPLRILWMALASYRAPRRIQAFGSFCAPCVILHGNVAGCTHATTLLRVLLIRTVQCLTAQYRHVQLRAMADDISLQWIGKKPHQ